ncbi:hypothetical protein BIW11_00142 [Tropilaelaps mercedesae]|uniref:Uncharacterized protein n=1 Tax=Tropilaelaps mercedesae TaxID=418985 RepID=A0A1V9Y1M8_9ACAR|nr:hypothetical protein BIW11_00142 [Tropilaelaps mercedesae]
MKGMLACAISSVVVLAGVLVSSPRAMAGEVAVGLSGGEGHDYGGGAGQGFGGDATFTGWENNYGGGSHFESMGHYGGGMATYGGGDFGGYDGGQGGHGGYEEGHGGYGDMGGFEGFDFVGGGGSKGHSLENEMAAHEDQAALSAVGLASLLTGGGLGGSHAHLASSTGSSYTISGPTQEIKSLHKIQTTSGGGHVLSRTAGHGGMGKAIILVKQPVAASHGGGHGWN